LVTARKDYFMLFEFAADNRRWTLQLVPFLDTFKELRKETISFVVSLCPSVWSNLAAAERICYLIFADLAKIYRENWSLIKSDKIMCNLHGNLCTCTIVSRLIPLRMRNVSYKILEKIKTHVLSSEEFFFSKIFLYEIMWKNLEHPDNLEHVQCMLNTKVYKHAIIRYVIFTAFPRQ